MASRRLGTSNGQNAHSHRGGDNAGYRRAEILAGQPKVEIGKMPVRFIGVGSYSLDIEADAYIATADYDEFIEIRQGLLIQMLKAVEHAGTALAVPIRETGSPRNRS